MHIFRENLLIPDSKKRALLYLRGYKKLKEKSNLDFIHNVKNKLAKTNVSSDKLDKIFKNPEKICLHQFICHRRLSIDFNKHFLISINDPKKIIKYGLPKKWREALVNFGFKVSFFSRINWSLYKFKWLLVGLFLGFKEIFRFFQINKFPKGPYVHLVGVNKDNLSNDERLNNFFNWLISQEEVKDYNFFTHTCKEIDKVTGKKKKIIYVNGDLPPIPSFIKLIEFTFWIFYNFFTGFLLNDKILLFQEKIKEKLVLYSKEKGLARKFFFNNQYGRYRPLWTYQNTNKNFEVILYFYSTNNFSFKYKNKRYEQQYNWYLSNWTEYWVWDDYQKKFLLENCPNASKITIKGPIPFSDGKWINNITPKKYIIVFDVQPFRDYYYPLIGIKDEYYTFQTNKLFLRDIEKVSSELNINVIIKRKRLSNKVSKEYLNLINKISQNRNWIEMDPRVSGFSAIRAINPIAIISMPYTSAAIITKQKSTKSIYYDPTNKLDPNFYANNGLSLVQNYNDLYSWVYKIYK